MPPAVYPPSSARSIREEVDRALVLAMRPDPRTRRRRVLRQALLRLSPSTEEHQGVCRLTVLSGVLRGGRGGRRGGLDGRRGRGRVSRRRRSRARGLSGRDGRTRRADGSRCRTGSLHGLLARALLPHAGTSGLLLPILPLLAMVHLDPHGDLGAQESLLDLLVAISLPDLAEDEVRKLYIC